MPKISDEKRAARKAQILQAAWICFQREGLQLTTMEDIIRASGLSAGAVYSYYASKDALIVAAVTTSLSGFAALVAPVLQKASAATPSDLFHSIVQVIDQFTVRDGYDLKRIAVLGWGEAQRNEGLRIVMRQYYIEFRSQLSAALQSSRDKRSADAIAVTLLSLILGYIVQSSLLGDVTPQDVKDGLVDISIV